VRCDLPSNLAERRQLEAQRRYEDRSLQIGSGSAEIPGHTLKANVTLNQGVLMDELPAAAARARKPVCRFRPALLSDAMPRFVRRRTLVRTPGTAMALGMPAGISTWLQGTGVDAIRPVSIVIIAVFALSVILISVRMYQLRRRAREEHRARLDLDRLLRWKTLSESSAAALAVARTSLEVTNACASELMHATRASAATVALLIDQSREVEVVQAAGYAEPLTERFALTPDSIIAAAIERRQVVAGPALDPPVRDPSFEVDALLRRHEAIIVIPLLAQSGAFGAVTLGFNHPRVFDDDERRHLAEVGRLAGEALARARLYESAERARVEGEAFRARADAELQERRHAEEAHRETEARYRALAARTHRLYSLNAALSEAVTVDAVAKVVVRLGRAVVGAAAGSVALCAENDALDTVYAEEYPPSIVEAWRRFSAEPGLCTTAAIETRRPVVVGSFKEWHQQFPRSAAAAADGGFTSAACLPLLVDNAAIGVLSFHFTVPVNFDQDYQALLTSVAHHAAQAIDRARLYETTQRARVDAEAANRAKDDFLSIVSHELRTPLNAILGWGTMLRDHVLDEARVARATTAIVSNATRQARLIEELLEVSRIVAGRVSLDVHELELADIVRGAVEAMSPTAAERGIELRIDCLPQARVTADPNRLEQVFGNLLANAANFTPAGGRVTVDGVVDGGIVRVRVVDTGCGIEPEVLPYIFDRFRQGNNTTARSVGGLGLGLFIARRLVEALDGQLIAESEGKGAGATFTVVLPLSAASGINHAPLWSARRGGSPSGTVRHDLSAIHVLVVDDEADVREMISSALQLHGARVTTSESAREALASLTNNDARIDVMLADIAMPEEDGYALIRQVRTHPNSAVATVPAAAVTACAREDERQRALAAGFHLHLSKPVAPRTVVDAVVELSGMATAPA
jgi:signal transduction histidine kinase/CheY-like chemotaxis protein